LQGETEKMAKPQISKGKDIFSDLDLQIMLCTEKIKNHERSIEKIKKMCNWYGPAGVNGIDYSRESTPGTHISFAEGLIMIDKDKERIKALKEERKELRKSKKRIQKIYEGLSGNEAEIYNCRVIRKMTQAAAAEEIGLSVRQFQRIESDMKDKGLLEK